MEKGECIEQSVRENPASATLCGPCHAKKATGVQQMIDNYLNDCDVFLAVKMNEKVVNNLAAKGKDLIFVEGGKVRELATKIAKEGV